MQDKHMKRIEVIAGLLLLSLLAKKSCGLFRPGLCWVQLHRVLFSGPEPSGLNPGPIYL